MALILTPRQLSHRADLYHQLDQLVSAGLGLIAAIEQLQRHPPSWSYRRPLAHMLKELREGNTFTEALKRTPGGWWPGFDIELLSAGENSGRIDSCFRLLADYYSDRATLARQLISSLAYPVFLVHFAIFILPFPTLFISGNVSAYLMQTLGVLLPIYIVVFVIIFAAQGKHGEAWRAMVEAIIRPLPVLGTGRHWLAISRLTAALGALLSAGVSIIEAWELAANASGSPAIRRTVRAWKPRMMLGETPAELVSSSSQFPAMFVAQYTSAEMSGRFDDTLARMHRYFQEEGTRKLKAVSQWVPRFLYLVIAAVIGYKVISFYAGYFQQINNIAM
jgi:type IV pilus assembly protein PilC